ncbi:hypothetical protein PMAC_000148 [Pneumocystis sp. 'macacae']|nr:hypothetical protein PMAC_000148 [Pneumocystis sp. 'macacae']
MTSKEYYEEKCSNNQCYTQPPPQYPQQSYCPQTYQGGYSCPPPNTYGPYCNNYYPQKELKYGLQQQPVYVQQQSSSNRATTGCLACLAACCACCMLEECLC